MERRASSPGHDDAAYSEVNDRVISIQRVNIRSNTMTKLPDYKITNHSMIHFRIRRNSDAGTSASITTAPS